MQIRITSALVQHGTVQFTRGQVLDLPAELAQQFLDAGDATEIPKVERAAMHRALHRTPSASGFAPASGRKG